MKVGFTAQEKLAQGNKTRDVQDRGRREVVQLEAVILQEYTEERVDWKPDASQQVRYEAHPFPPGWIGEIFRQNFACEGGQSCSNRDQIRRGKESLYLELNQLLMGYIASLPIAFFRAMRAGGRTGDASHVEWFPLAKL